MKRSALIRVVLVTLLLAMLSQLAAAKETWTSVRSKHFFLIGDASERDIQKVALKLEQFRDVFSRLFTQANLNSSVPTTVIVFKSDGVYRPFKPLYQGKPANVSGYFQPGEDVNYITLTAELREETPYATIFHEYVHSLTRDNMRLAPLWFSEGLAEYYSTFEMSDGEKKVWLGKAIARHVYLLRENKFLPLPALFTVDHGSPHYNEKDKKGVFYAQSWALVHYLLLGNNSQRQPQFQRYLGLLATGAPIDESFRQAFQTDYATVEKELKNYIGRNTYPAQIVTFNQRLEFDTGMQSAPISEAEAQFYLGDLLLHTKRLEDAEGYLQKAIALDANLAAAHASLGMLRMRQKRFAEAKQSLERAVAANSQSHLAHYYYAYTLSRERAGENELVTSFPPETAHMMRASLRRAIELAPRFPESYRLLAWVNLVTGEQLDESVTLLKRALALAPGRQELAIMLAQLYLRKQDFDAARQTIEPIARSGADPRVRAQAQSLLDTITQVTERLAQFKTERNAAQARPPVSGGDAPRLVLDPNRPVLRRRLEGEQVRGLLLRLDCAENKLTLVVKAGERTLELHSEARDRVQFISYTKEVRDEIECGPRNPPIPVLVTYRTSTDAKSKFDGELMAVEFVKPE